MFFNKIHSKKNCLIANILLFTKKIFVATGDHLSFNDFKKRASVLANFVHTAVLFFEVFFCLHGNFKGSLIFPKRHNLISYHDI
jgi:hypothetical protein